LNNPNIGLRTVDYLRDAGAAQKLKTQYLTAAPTDKNLVIFDCGGKTRILDGNMLAKVTLEQLPSEEGKELRFRRKPVAFLGEMFFTAALIDVISPKPFVAYFLTGHGEHQVDSGDEIVGYLKFASLLQQNSTRVQVLSLTGTNSVPADCNLLVIAGPRSAILEPELSKLDQYLAQGGRLLALFNSASLNRETGLEKLLAGWGVQVSQDLVLDPEPSPQASLGELVVSAFSHHALVNPLLGSGLDLVQPRRIGKVEPRTQAADAPRVEEIAFS